MKCDEKGTVGENETVAPGCAWEVQQKVCGKNNGPADSDAFKCSDQSSQDECKQAQDDDGNKLCEWNTDGDGDDEVIRIDLDTIPADVKSLNVVVNCYTGSFSDVRDAYVRLVAIKTGHELARFTLSNDYVKPGMVFARISRIEEQQGSWRLLAIGKQCAGKQATSEETKKACSITH